MRLTKLGAVQNHRQSISFDHRLELLLSLTVRHKGANLRIDLWVDADFKPFNDATGYLTPEKFRLPKQFQSVLSPWIEEKRIRVRREVNFVSQWLDRPLEGFP